MRRHVPWKWIYFTHPCLHSENIQSGPETSNILVRIKAFKSWPWFEFLVFLILCKILHICNIEWGGGEDYDIRMWIAFHPRLMVVHYDGVSGIPTWPFLPHLCQWFPPYLTSSLFYMISQSFDDHANIGLWPSKCLGTGNISRRTFSIYSLLFIPQNATLNILKHLLRNSIIHGLNRNRQNLVFFVIQMLGFGLGCVNKLVSRRVSCTLNINNLVGL